MLALKHEVGDEVKERYVVREVLGAGAFGTVYRVEEALGARVVSLACKEMHVMDDPATGEDERESALKMFQEEAFLLSTLRDAHIPSAHFESQRGVWLACPICGLSFKGTRHCPDHGSELSVVRERYYLIMDFLDGLDLEQVVAANGNRPLDEAQVLEWCLQVCSALEAVHAKGFSHRDIKPANIKIQKDSPAEAGGASATAGTSSTSSTSPPAFSLADSTSAAGPKSISIEGRAMLIDFGLVKPSAMSGKYGTVVMGRGPVLGTSGYAPPSLDEQASPDARTDIVALGMTMYRLLTGLDPSEPDQLEKMRGGKPRDFNPALSAMVENIILRASNPDREARYPDVRSMRADIQAARYPIETRCPHCAHLNLSIEAPSPDTRCERCGRALGTILGQAAPPSTSNTSRAPRPPLKPPATPGASAAAPSPPWKKKVGNDPRAGRIDAIRNVLGQPVGSAMGSVLISTPEMLGIRARLAEMSEVLARAAKFTPGTPDDCPVCRQRTLKVVSGAGGAQCPLCHAADLVPRDNSIPACPVCREGNLPEFALRPHELFCPVCREAPLSVVEKRAFLSLLADDRWQCAHCSAEWDLRGHDATLEAVNDDPFQVGAEFLKQSLPQAQWKSLSARSDKWFECDQCSAQFEARDNDGLALLHIGADPFGVGGAFKNRVLGRGAWARLARGEEAEDASHDCPSCKSSWNLDQKGGLALVRAGTTLPAWAANLVSRSLPVPSWHSLAEGKTSPYPGRLCQNLSCRSEWNDDGPSWSLAATKDVRFAPQVGQTLPPEAWRRRAQGLPAPDEVARLRVEDANLKARLSVLEGQTRAVQSQRAEQGRNEARAELATLLKASALDGHVRLQRMTPAKSADDWKHQPGTFVVLPPQVVRLALFPSEALRWEGKATLCEAIFEPSLSRYKLARREVGVLVVTDERVQFVNLHDDKPTQVWECSVPRLERAFVVLVNPNAPGQSQVVIVESRAPATHSGTPRLNAVGFEVAPSAWNIKCDDEMIGVSVEANDLAALLMRLKI